VEIRRLRPDEWPALRALRLRALASDPDAFGETLADAEAHPDEEWRRRADDPSAPTFVAEAPSGLVGMVMGGPAPDERPAAALYSMWVAPEARAQGVGGALIDAVVDWARSAGYPAIGLGVTTTNAAAIALYARKGFADIGERYPLREGGDLEIQVMGMRF
jgi:ribosomal protein S18 acetylase RimI-like enzyme